MFEVSVTNGLAFQDEQTVVYIAGGNIVLYGIDQKAQKVIPCSINAQGKLQAFPRVFSDCFFSALTTMTVSPNRRVIAIAERINDRPQVTIYDLQSGKRRKALQSELIKSNEIVFLTLLFGFEISTNSRWCTRLFSHLLVLGKGKKSWPISTSNHQQVLKLMPR